MNTESYPLPENSPEPEFHDSSEEAPAENANNESSTRQRGRPSKRTPELEAAILECLELGMTIAETCDVCDISETQFRSWRQHCPEFAALVRRGQAGAVRIHLSMIRNAAEKNWRASAWWLERRRPERWGKSATSTFEGRKAPGHEEEDHEIIMAQVRKSREMLSALVREREEKVAETLARLETGGVFPAPASVPETTPDSEGNDGVPFPERTDAPAPCPNETGEGAQARQPDAAPPVQSSEREAAWPAPSARMTPSVFIGGARSGQPAEFDGKDASTHAQGGYRLVKIYFTYEGRARFFQVFADPATANLPLAREAIRLLQEGNRPVTGALAIQENGPLYGTHGN